GLRPCQFSENGARPPPPPRRRAAQAIIPPFFAVAYAKDGHRFSWFVVPRLHRGTPNHENRWASFT
ncbi:MAG TPA: hypothetical protein VJA25_02190, partial [Dehalococcoidia bacterium]|nr:hypothetical protein [Dehalococcoidia bacterium]